MVSCNQLLPQVYQVADRISRYLESHPNALDSLDGIVQWWLLKQKIEESTELVQAAIDYLVSQGVVREIELGGKTFYSRCDQAKTDGTDDKLSKNS